MISMTRNYNKNTVEVLYALNNDLTRIGIHA